MAPGLVNFIPTVAYHFCLNLPEILSQPCDDFLPHRCKRRTVREGAAYDASDGLRSLAFCHASMINARPLGEYIMHSGTHVQHEIEKDGSWGGGSGGGGVRRLS